MDSNSVPSYCEATALPFFVYFFCKYTPGHLPFLMMCDLEWKEFWLEAAIQANSTFDLSHNIGNRLRGLTMDGHRNPISQLLRQD